MKQETQKVINDLKEYFGIDVENLIKKGLLPVNAAKKWLIRELYFAYAREGNTIAKGGRTYTDIKYQLSIDYDISVSSIEKIIYRGLNRPRVTLNVEP